MDERINFLYVEEDNDFRKCAKQMELIYEKMQDDMSRVVFINRVMFSITGDAKFMREIVLGTKIGQSLYSKLKQFRTSVFVYGVGRRGQRLIEMFPEFDWGGGIDVNKAGSYCCNLPVYGLKFLQENKDISIVISILYEYMDVKKKLLDLGIQKERIIALSEFDKKIENEIYFDTLCVERFINDTKYFIDAGAFDGANTINYLNKYFQKNPDKALVFAFEPDYDNYVNCAKALKEYQGIQVWNMGLSDQNKENFFEKSQGNEGHISKYGNKKVEVVSLDKMMENYDIGFIKMDIEGAEEKALSGCRNIITAQSPMLAISIYHKRSDIWKIPKLILDMNPNYVFYMRHYTVSYGDTVLYAVCNEQE